MDEGVLEMEAELEAEAEPAGTLAEPEGLEPPPEGVATLETGTLVMLDPLAGPDG